jgi:hypothetical protein
MSDAERGLASRRELSQPSGFGRQFRGYSTENVAQSG